jgi:hypothetical protein
MSLPAVLAWLPSSVSSSSGTSAALMMPPCTVPRAPAERGASFSRYLHSTAQHVEIGGGRQHSKHMAISHGHTAALPEFDRHSECECQQVRCWRLISTPVLHPTAARLVLAANSISHIAT